MTKQEIAAKIEKLQKELDELKGATEKFENTDFNRGEIGDSYYTIGNWGKAERNFETRTPLSQALYDRANYCRNGDIMRKRAAEETLSRLIWREAEIANTNRTMKDSQILYMVGYYAKDKSFLPWLVHASLVGGVGFFHIDDARSCIKNVVIPFVKDHPELGWELKEEEEI